MVTKHTRELWPYEPKIMPEDREETEQESAIFQLLAQEAPKEPTSALAWAIYGVFAMLVLVFGGWHFVAWWLKGAPL